MRKGFVVLVVLAVSLASGPLFAQAVEDPGLVSDAVRARGELIAADRAARTPSQRKLSRELLYLVRVASGRPAVEGVDAVHGYRPADVAPVLMIAIEGTISPALLAHLETIGATRVTALPEHRLATANVPAAQVEALGARDEVDHLRFVRPRPMRAVQDGPPVVPTPGLQNGEGDAAHAAAAVRAQYGVTGEGFSVCVMSDDVTYLGSAIANGSLSKVTVLPGLSGTDHRDVSGEGTAMLEIVHRIAPGATLMFATGGRSPVEMAANIDALVGAGCDIIVDDLAFDTEAPFQDDVVAQAVDRASAAGVLFFSAAGNDGNLPDATAGTWEGYYNFVPPSSAGNTVNWEGVNYELHQFPDGSTWNTVRDPGPRTHTVAQCRDNRDLVCNNATLYWNDPMGVAGWTYMLFVRDQNGIRAASDPDALGGRGAATVDIQAGDQLAIGMEPGADSRFLRLYLFEGRLDQQTGGATYGHNAVDAELFVGVGSTSAAGMSAPFQAGPDLQAEDDSSDGPRRIFFDAQGHLLNDYEVGVARQKPDVLGADCVRTDLPVQGWAPFCGNSAAAPQLAGIAALLMDKFENFEPWLIRSALVQQTIPIGNPGWNSLTGTGVVMAPLAFASAAALSRADFSTQPPTLANLTLTLNQVSSGGGSGCPSIGFNTDIGNNVPLFTLTAPARRSARDTLTVNVLECDYRSEPRIPSLQLTVNGNAIARDGFADLTVLDGVTYFRSTFTIPVGAMSPTDPVVLQFVAGSPAFYSIHSISVVEP